MVDLWRLQAAQLIEVRKPRYNRAAGILRAGILTLLTLTVNPVNQCPTIRLSDSLGVKSIKR